MRFMKIAPRLCKYTSCIGILLFILHFNTVAQTTIFTESMGTVAAITTIATHETNNGFDNDPYTMTGTGDVRNTTPSAGYTGASANANVFITSIVGRDFQIAEISTLGYNTLTLSFGAHKSTTASNMTDLILEYSTDGVSYTSISFPAQPTGAGTASWRLISGISLPVAAENQANLRLRWRQSGSTTQFRIDDITLTGFSACAAPTTQASSIVFSSVGTNQMTVGWTNGNGSNRVVKMNTVNTFTNPANGTDPAANPVYGGGEQVVYNGNGNSVTVTNLAPSTTYWFRVYEYNCTGANTVYITSTATNNPNSQATDPLVPLITVNPAVLSGMNYMFGSGPSASQNYTVSGSNLALASGNITLTAPANFEISIDNTNFFASLNLPYNTSTLNATTIYVRLRAGLAIGNYNAENIVHSGGGAANANVNCSGAVLDPLATPTIFDPGDFAVVGVNSNVAVCIGGYASGDDEISFFAFKDITNGTRFFITDNGYQRKHAGLWAGTEGVYEITRTGGTISAGTVITIRLTQSAPFLQGMTPDNDWSCAKVTGFTGTLILNTNGDQIFFTQGGNWTFGADHTCSYVGGTFLFAFNTNSSWTSFADNTQHSGLIPGMECFNMMPGVATDYIKYNGDITPTSKRGWIDRINNPTNWLPLVDCAGYEAGGYDYRGGITLPINAGGFSPGIWTGDEDINWFNCANWQDMRVPDENINVFIPSAGVTFEPTIGNPPTVPVPYTTAYCNDITIENGRTLTMNHANSSLEVWGNFNQNGNFAATNGIVKFLDDNSSLSAINPVVFYNILINKTTASNTLALNNSIAVNNVLNLTSGRIVTGANMVIVNNTSTAAIINHSVNSFIAGNLRRYVTATGSFDFPVGSASIYEYANILLNSSSGLGYIDAFFTNPHTTPIDITPLGLYVSGSLLEELLDYGFWTLTPNAGTYNYDVTLTSRGHTNPGPTAESHAVIKRPNAAMPWVSQGTHNNGDQSMGAGWVTARRRSLTVFSDFAIAKHNAGSLPVEMLTFDANLSNNDVLVSWTTASEINNHYFELERSLNNTEYFETIAFIEGNGNSNIQNHYSYVDTDVAEGVLYYRLKQVDFDGKWEYAGIRAITNLPNNDELVLVNQITEDNSVSFDLLNITGNYIVVEMFDITGRILYSKQFATDQSSYKIRIGNEEPSGIYFIKVRDSKSTVSEKFLLQ